MRTTAELSGYVLDQVAGTELSRHPWPHAYLPNALPADLALRLSRSFDDMDMEFFEQTDKAKSYRLRTTGLSGDQEPHNRDWSALRDVLSSTDYRDRVSELTGIPLADSAFTLDLWEYRSGDWLAPHLDKPEKVVTQIFYLTEGWQPEHDGRLLVLTADDQASVDRALPPRLGSSAILVRSQKSWHAVEAPGPDSPARRSVTATFWHHDGPAPRTGQ